MMVMGRTAGRISTERESCDTMKKKDRAGKETAAREKKKPVLLKVFAHIMIILLALMICAAGAVFFYARYTQTHYEITFYQETSKKVSGNIRAVVISDIHNREYGERNETLISDIRSLRPDVILFAGDMVQKTEDDYQPMLDLVSSLTDIAPCYGVLGNHESERIYYSDDKELPEKFRSAGLKLLRNAKEVLRVGSDTIQLIGVEGTSHGFEEYGGRRFMDSADIDPAAYCIVMAHIPILFDKQLSAYDFDLGIAGHTHGGLVILPHFGGLYSDEEGFFPNYSGGRYVLSRQQSLIISQGLGDSRPIPRINNMPELVVVDINCY